MRKQFPPKITKRNSGRFKPVSLASSFYPAYKSRQGNKDKKSGRSYSLWQITRENDTESLKIRLTHQPELVYEADHAGYSCLHVASKFNLPDIGQILLNYNADKNIITKSYGVSPLHIAAKHNSSAMCRLLLDKGAKCDITDFKKKTPLHYAARRGNIQAAEILLHVGHADVNKLDEDRISPLHEAIIQKRADIVPLLIRFGAKIHQEDINKCTPFLYAAAEGMVDTMKLLLLQNSKDGNDKINQNWIYRHRHKLPSSQPSISSHCDIDGNTALHLAVQNSEPQAVEFLIGLGLDVDTLNNNHQAPLHMAAINGCIQIVHSLLAGYCTVDIKDAEFWTPILKAAAFNNAEVIDVLMKRGGNINARSSNQMTPLMIATWKGHLETVEFLLKNGAQIAETDSRLRSTLHFAVETSNAEILHALLKHSGEHLLETPDFEDLTVLHYAAMIGDAKVIDMLIEHGSTVDSRDQNGNTPLHVAAEKDQCYAIAALINSSLNELNEENDDGLSPLMVAVQAGNYKAVKLLLSRGADVTSRDDDSCTPLLLAARYGEAKIMSILLDNYADINANDKLKNTSLHLACEAGHTPCVSLLLRKHILVNARNSIGKTALDLAIDGKHTEVVKEMLADTDRCQELMEFKDMKGKCPLDAIIEKVPNACLTLMDNCVEKSHHGKNEVDYTVKYDFVYLDPGPNTTSCPFSLKKRYYALDTMVKFRREELLSHPLVQTLMMSKWNKYGRRHFYVNMLLYFVYLTLQSIYAINTPNITTTILDNVRKCPVYLTDAEKQNQTIVQMKIDEAAYSYTTVQDMHLEIIAFILNGFILIFIIQQLLRFIAMGWRYFINVNNLLTLLMLFSTVIFITPPNTLPCELRWRSGWISTAVAWMLIMGYLRSADKIGIYFVMFEEVVRSLAKVSLVFFLFTIAFAQAFTITMAQRDGFKNNALLTVFSMAVGEINYIDNFVVADNSPFAADNSVLIFIFMVLVPIALINFLIGVAVGDIDKIRKQAYFTISKILISDLCRTEERMPLCIQRRYYQRYYQVHPNKKKKSLWNKIWQTSDQDETFVKDENDDPITATVDGLKQDMGKAKTKITQMHTILSQTQEMIKSLCEKMDVEYNFDAISVISDRSEL